MKDEVPKPDMVNRPPHYNQGDIECIDAMIQVFGEAQVKVYCRINAFKYIWRHRFKDEEAENLAKANWYWRFSMGDDPRSEG